MTHKVLECLANIQLQAQNTNGHNWMFKDDCLLSPIPIYRYDILKPYTLSKTEIDIINRTRINKYNYKDNCQLKYGHIRYGKDLVELLIQHIYSYYTKTHHNWQPVDLKDVTNWIWMVLDYNNGMFDPRQRIVFETELPFDLIIDKPWANYSFVLDNKKFEGKLRFRGTIDLIFEINSDTIEILEFKTGQRLNWATGKEKDYKALSQDPQLIFYYYALRKLFPNKSVIVSIFWIRDGGPFTFAFDDSMLDKAEQLIRSHFQEVVQCIHPKMIDPFQKCFKCTKICDYYNMLSPDGQTNMCSFVNKEIEQKGIDLVTEQYHNNTFNIYQVPGTV